jgi:hypothetical protein
MTARVPGESSLSSVIQDPEPAAGVIEAIPSTPGDDRVLADIRDQAARIRRG